MASPIFLALTQGDPVGVGPEILLKVAARWSPDLGWAPILVAERAALEALEDVLSPASFERLRYVGRGSSESTDSVDEAELVALARANRIPVLDPVGLDRRLEFQKPTAADARGGLAAIDVGLDLAERGVASALVTAPVNKATIARWVRADFRGHTDYLAHRLGSLRYGRDYLMAFLSVDLRVALLSTHVPLREAIETISTDSVVEALRCLHRNLDRRDSVAKSAASKSSLRAPRLALAGLNPHAGEGGLLGLEEQRILEPAIEMARAEGIDVVGPESPDTIFFRARGGEIDWVLALYHDQGLIPIKTLAFGSATNWTLGLPVLRTSVDHGTAYAIAGRGQADAEPMWAVIQTTLGLIDEL